MTHPTSHLSVTSQTRVRVVRVKVEGGEPSLSHTKVHLYCTTRGWLLDKNQSRKCQPVRQ